MACEIPIKSEKSSSIIQRLLALIVDILTVGIIVLSVILLVKPLANNKQSPGKYILGIALIKENNMGLTKCILRLFLVQLSLCFFFIGITTAMKDDKKRMLHDKIFKTIPVIL